MLIQMVAEAIVERWAIRGLRSQLRALQADNVLLGALRAAEAENWRFGDMWLSGEWHVRPGSMRLGSTTVDVDGIGPDVRHGASGSFSLPQGLDTTVLTVEGPRGTFELAMDASSEAWFREAVATRH